MSRRRIPTTSRILPIPTSYQSSSNNSEFTEPIIKHTQFVQSIASNRSEFFNELTICVFSLIAAGSQFLHLYRSAWWFSDTQQLTINFYLIDKNLVFFIVVMLSRRVIYSAAQNLIEVSCPEKYKEIVEKSFKYLYLVCLETIFLICNWLIFQNYSIVYLFYLIYPIILYLVIFKCKIDPFLKVTYNQDQGQSFLGGEPVHSCSNNAADIRQEVSEMRSDFNHRFKQIIFTSVLNAYYSCFIPWCFVEKHLFYNKFWVTQHFFTTFVSLITMCAGNIFPIKYCDVLHRSAIHLGTWVKLNPRTNHAPPVNWTKNQVFSYGTYVRYSGEVYKSVSDATSSLPNDSGHQRFYFLFKNPTIVYLIISSTHFTTVIAQLSLIFYSHEYQYIISIGLLLITNYYTLFRLVRDYFIVKKIYNK